MEDQRIGRALRALRHRLGWRQLDLADRARVSQPSISLLERGHVGGLSIRALRQICQAMDANVVVLVRWRGGDLDRLLDERHARLGAVLARRLEQLGWTVMPEVSYSVFGERGSIDLLCWHAASRTLLVVELKSELTSIEETLRRFDVKRRLAARVAADRLGWQAANVGRLLVLPSDRTARRRVAAHAPLLARALPNSAADVRRWLREPSGPLDGILFMTDSDQASGRHGTSARRRVRRPTAAPVRA